MYHRVKVVFAFTARLTTHDLFLLISILSRTSPRVYGTTSNNNLRFRGIDYANVVVLQSIAYKVWTMLFKFRKISTTWLSYLGRFMIIAFLFYFDREIYSVSTTNFYQS